MTNVIFLDLNKTKLNPDCYVLSEATKNRLKSKKTPEGQIASTQAYCLVQEAYKRIFYKNPPVLDFYESGKPYFKDSKTKVSISHSGSICVVAFSENDVGVDVEFYDYLKEKTALIDRFVNKSLQKYLKTQKSKKTDVTFYEFADAGLVLIENTEKSYQENAYLWTGLEALLKTEDGFKQIKNINEISKSARICARFFNEFVITVAVKI